MRLKFQLSNLSPWIHAHLSHRPAVRSRTHTSIATETLFKYPFSQSDCEDNSSIGSTFFPVQEAEPIVDL